jgi:AcrR family transcriptional regulator
MIFYRLQVKESPYRMARSGIAASNSHRDQRRETIMSVAREVFFEYGYSAASMSAIAARLGGSKGTLYNYFKSKEELFEAQVRDLCGSVADGMQGIEGPPREALTAFGEQLLQHLYSEQTVNLFRMLVAEARRSPELGRIFFEVGPARGRKGLEIYLESARANGFLHLSDCALAADQFLSLCKGSVHLQFLLNLIAPLSPRAIRLQVAQAVDAFMALYGALPAHRDELTRDDAERRHE